MKAMSKALYENTVCIFFCNIFFSNVHGIAKMKDLHKLFVVFLTYPKEKEISRLI